MCWWWWAEGLGCGCCWCVEIGRWVFVRLYLIGECWFAGGVEVVAVVDVYGGLTVVGRCGAAAAAGIAAAVAWCI